VGAVTGEPSTAVRAGRIALVLGGLAVSLGLDFGLRTIVPDSSLRQLLLLAACNCLVALSLNVINGMAGQFSIGHAGFLGIGGYTSAILASNLHHALGGGAPTFSRSLLVVPVCLAGLFGLLVGLPSLRLRGDYLAIVTLGFAEIFRLVIATASATSTGGVLARLGGQSGYAGPDGQGIPLYAGPFWVFGLTLLLAIVAWRIKFSGWGRALRALREDEIAAAAVGVDPSRYRVGSFVIAAVGAGIAGGLMAIMRDGMPIVNPDTYGFQASFDAITMVILGGSGSVSGAMLGAFFVTFSIRAIEQLQGLPVVQALRQHHDTLDLDALRMIVYAIALVVLMAWRPEGLLGERELFGRRRTRA